MTKVQRDELLELARKVDGFLADLSTVTDQVITDSTALIDKLMTLPTEENCITEGCKNPVGPHAAYAGDESRPGVFTYVSMCKSCYVTFVGPIFHAFAKMHREGQF